MKILCALCVLFARGFAVIEQATPRSCFLDSPAHLLIVDVLALSKHEEKAKAKSTIT